MKAIATVAFAAIAIAFAGPGLAADDGVKIGILDDMTGPYASIAGMGSVVAAQMAVEDFGGKVLGKPIQIVWADHQNKADVGAGIARRWYDVEGVDAIFDVIREINGEGTTILLIEQNALIALHTAARAYVLETGSVTLAGPASELLASADVQRAYLGM